MSLVGVPGTANTLSEHTSPLPKSNRRHAVHALQVQAFLDAADEVDIDQEIVDDILQGFNGKLNIGEDGDVDIESNVNPSPEDATIPEDGANEDDWEGADDDSQTELEELTREEEGKIPGNYGAEMKLGLLNKCYWAYIQFGPPGHLKRNVA